MRLPKPLLVTLLPLLIACILTYYLAPISIDACPSESFQSHPLTLAPPMFFSTIIFRTFGISCSSAAESIFANWPNPLILLSTFITCFILSYATLFLVRYLRKKLLEVRK